MSLTKCTAAVDNISNLADKPALTAAQLKAKFDKTGADIKTYLNNTLTDEIDTLVSGKVDSGNIQVISYHDTSVGQIKRNLAYPTGFTYDNCVAIAVQIISDGQRGDGNGSIWKQGSVFRGSIPADITTVPPTNFDGALVFKSTHMEIIYPPAYVDGLYIRIVLMKIS